MPSFFVGNSLGGSDGWDGRWLENQWSGVPVGTPGTVNVSEPDPLPQLEDWRSPPPPLPSDWPLPDFLRATTSANESNTLVSAVYGGTIKFLGDDEISTTRIVVHHQLRTETFPLVPPTPGMNRSFQRIDRHNDSAFFAPFARATLGNVFRKGSSFHRRGEEETAGPPVSKDSHSFFRVCSCDQRNATERCPRSLPLKGNVGPAHICPLGSFVIRRHLPRSMQFARMQHRFSCVHFQEQPPAAFGVHALANDQLIVTIDNCRIVYDEGSVQMAGDGELLAFTLKTSRCRHAAYFVGCGPLVTVHNGYLQSQISTQGTGALVSAEYNATSVLCDRCAADFGAIGSERWCGCCLANCGNKRAYCNSEGYCQEGGHACPNMCPTRPICPVTEPVPPPADGRKCAGTARDAPPPPAPTPPSPTTTTVADVGTRILLTPSPFKAPPCIAGSIGCSGDAPTPTPTPTTAPTRSVPCEFNRFTGRCSRDDCPLLPLSHVCAMVVANKTAICSCTPVRSCEWSEAEKRCTGSACPGDGSPCLPIQLSDGRVACNATCATGDAPEKAVAARLAVLASLRSVAPARAIAPIAVGIDTALPISTESGALALLVDWRSVAKSPSDKTLLTVLLRFRDELLLLSSGATKATTSAELLEAMNRLWFKVAGGAGGAKVSDPCALPEQSPASLWWRVRDTRNIVTAFDDWWTRASIAPDTAQQFTVRLRSISSSTSTCRNATAVRPLPTSSSTTTTLKRNAADEACCVVDAASGGVQAETLCIDAKVTERTVLVKAPLATERPVLLFCDCGARCNLTLLVSPATPIVPAILQADRVPPMPAGLFAAPAAVEKFAVSDRVLAPNDAADASAPFFNATTALGVLLFVAVLMLAIAIAVIAVQNRRLRSAVRAAEAHLAVEPAAVAVPMPATTTTSKRRRSKRADVNVN